MRYIVACIASSLILAATLIGHASPSVNAGGDTPPATGGGARFDVSAFLHGYGNPGTGWDSPCEAPYEYRSIWIAEDAGTGRGQYRTRADGVLEYLWQVSCYDPVTRISVDIREFWIALPDPATLVPNVAAMLPGYLDPPDVVWPNMSPEHGWLFVKVPMDFRINNLAPVTVTATVSNAAGSATASATATPTVVSFVSGEGGGAECAFDDAVAGYVPRVSGACAYTYENSSAVVGGKFDTTTTVRWDITSAPPSAEIPAILTTFSNQALAVSEVQAVVTCQGSGC